MSAIAGMIDWSGGPAGAAVRRALEALHLHGRDGEGLWDGGEVALGWRQTILHAEDHADNQPLTGGGERFKLVFDGRLDNREDLARHLSLAPEEARDWPDSRYMLGVFEKHGVDGVKHLLGDFVWAAWDTTKRELFLARDHVGARPLVYFRGANFFAFATHPDALFTHPRIPRRINDEAIVRALMIRRPLPDRCFFDGILRLPPGHLMKVTAASACPQPYWCLEDTPPVRFARDDDYVEAVREIFTEAVRCRLRTIHPVGSHLSSGWDSGSVTSVTAGLLAGQGRRLRSYTSVPLRDWVPAYHVPGQISDEGPLAAVVAARHENVDHVLVEGPGIWDFAVFDHSGRVFAAPMVTCHNTGWVNLLHSTARSQGVRVMLTGGLGNLTMSYEGFERLPNLLRQARLAELIREWRAAHSYGKSYKNLMRRTFLPLLPKELGIGLLALVGRRPFATAEATMLSAELRSHAAEIEQAERGSHRPTRRTILPRHCLRGQEAAMGYFPAGWDLDVRDPTIDKRIVSFCYAIPEDQFFSRGRSRWLLRRVMTGVLPDAILDQRGRGRQAAD